MGAPVLEVGEDTMTAQLTAEPRTELHFDRSPEGEPLKVIRDHSSISMRFNIMAGRFVEETFLAKEFRIWDRYIEVEFDRTYHSDMEKSPSHVIFLTSLALTQKLIYLYLCHEFGFDYQPGALELLKIWPTKIDVRTPAMVTSEKAIVHRLYITDIKSYGEKRFKALIQSKVDNTVAIDAEVPFFLI
jgi:hypothetical protein